MTCFRSQSSSLVRDASDQISEFKDLFTPMPGPRIVNWSKENALFVFAFGINDMVSNRGDFR